MVGAPYCLARSKTKGTQLCYKQMETRTRAVLLAVLTTIMMATSFKKAERMSLAKGSLGVRLAWLCLLLALSFTTKVTVNLVSLDPWGICGCPNHVFRLNEPHTFPGLGRGICVKSSVP